MLELCSFVRDVSAFLAELENSFQILEEYFPIFFYATPNGMAADTNTLLCLICIIYICSLTFLSLDSQQNNKSIPDSQCLLMSVV